MVGGPPKERIAANTFTVTRAKRFCAVHHPLPYLRYAVYLHGYFMPVLTGSDGPPQGIMLDRPRHMPERALRSRIYAHGIFGIGFGIPASGTWMTSPGLLSCRRGASVGFSLFTH